MDYLQDKVEELENIVNTLKILANEIELQDNKGIKDETLDMAYWIEEEELKEAKTDLENMETEESKDYERQLEYDYMSTRF